MNQPCSHGNTRTTVHLFVLFQILQYLFSCSLICHCISSFCIRFLFSRRSFFRLRWFWLFFFGIFLFGILLFGILLFGILLFGILFFGTLLFGFVFFDFLFFFTRCLCWTRCYCSTFGRGCCFKSSILFMLCLQKRKKLWLIFTHWQ